MPLDKSVYPFICNALNAVFEEVEKLDSEERLPATTEIIESVFGSHKNHSASGGQGITGNVLTIAALVGKKETSEEVSKSMEQTSVKSVLNWINDKVGNTLAKMRSKFFKNEVGNEIKRQNLTGDQKGLFAV